MTNKKSFSDININGFILKNRFIVSPISLNNSDDKGKVTDNLLSFYNNLAKNHFSMIIVGNACVSKKGFGCKNELGIGKRYHFEGLKKLSRIIKQHNCVASIQINHIGPQGNTHHTNQEVVGPSNYIVPDIGINVRPLTLKEIYKIEDDFVKSIKQAFEAGFDFVELHLAHGYLLHSFLSSHTNKRTDNYGGSYENRFRIIKNILDKIKKLNIDTRKIGAKLSANDFTQNGINLEKLKKIINSLDKYKLAYYSVTAGIYETAKMKYIKMKEGDYWRYAKFVKNNTSAKVIAQGGIYSGEIAEKILHSTKCDLIGMAQAVITDPQIITKILNNNEKNIFKCLAHNKVGSCHRCRYLKQKDSSFDCVSPVSWKPYNYSKKLKKANIDLWNKILNAK